MVQDKEDNGEDPMIPTWLKLVCHVIISSLTKKPVPFPYGVTLPTLTLRKDLFLNMTKLLMSNPVPISKSSLKSTVSPTELLNEIL